MLQDIPTRYKREEYPKGKDPLPSSSRLLRPSSSNRCNEFKTLRVHPGISYLSLERWVSYQLSLTYTYCMRSRGALLISRKISALGDMPMSGTCRLQLYAPGKSGILSGKRDRDTWSCDPNCTQVVPRLSSEVAEPCPTPLGLSLG